MTKNPKLQVCKQHFPSEALSINQPTKYSASKGTCVGTAAILDFSIVEGQDGSESNHHPGTA